MIGPDKLNQAKHIRFFQDSLREHMKKHAEILKDLGILYAPDFLINAGQSVR